MSDQVATETKLVRRENKSPQLVNVDICVVGAGSAGLSAALEAAKLGRRVALVDSLPVLGGQMVNSIIGTFCGLFANGTHGHQFTYGMADDILRDLGAIPKALYRRHGPVTTVVYYDEVLLGRWIEEAVRKAGITVILGAVLRGVNLVGRRVSELDIATRYGDIKLSATGFVDASGDAALTWLAGFACRESDRKVYGTQMVVLENIVESAHPSREEMAARMKEKSEKYNLPRHNAVSFVIPGRGIAALNMTHTDTPLEPLAAARSQLEGKAQADRCVEFLMTEFPACFGNSHVRAYGNPGIRQNSLDRGPAPTHTRRSPQRHKIRGCDRPHRMAGRTSRYRRGLCLADVSGRSHSLYSAWQPHARRSRQRCCRRPLRRRRSCSALKHSCHGTLHRHGSRCGACARPCRKGQRPSARYGDAAQTFARQS